MADTHEHNISGKKLGWTILLNSIITVTEFIGGALSGSLALVSDAGHNFSDVLSLIISYIGDKISKKKSTTKHSFGFKRVEIFTALINALALWAIGIIIIIEAIKRSYNPEPIALGLMLGIAVIGLVGNLVSVLILQREKDSNLNMKAAYLHLFYDTISSVAVIATAIIIYFTQWLILDVIVSIIIALMIFWSGFGIIKRTIHILMQGLPEGIDFEEVHKVIGKVPGVADVHSIHMWSINSEEIFLSCHITLKKKNANSDKIIHNINKILEDKYHIEHTTIQVEKNKLCADGALCTK